VEGIVIRGDVATDPLQSGAIEPGEGKGEAGPEFFLELGEHGLHRHDEDAPALAALDQLGEKDAALDRFPQTDGISNEDALAGLGEGEGGGLELEGKHVHGPLMAEVNGCVARRGRPEMRLEHEPGRAVKGAGVGYSPCQAGVNDLDFAIGLLDVAEETSLFPLNEGGKADHGEHFTTRRGAVDVPDQPLFVSDRDPRAGSELDDGRGGHGLVDCSHDGEGCKPGI